LSEVFNSKLLDIYFRTYNGNTEVSATEIRDMPLPALKTIKMIGKAKMKEDISTSEVNHLFVAIRNINRFI
jgi:adenine-specific DNA-methyltransferase